VRKSLGKLSEKGKMLTCRMLCCEKALTLSLTNIPFQKFQRCLETPGSFKHDLHSYLLQRWILCEGFGSSPPRRLSQKQGASLNLFSSRKCRNKKPSWKAESPQKSSWRYEEKVVNVSSFDGSKIPVQTTQSFFSDPENHWLFWMITDCPCRKLRGTERNCPNSV
jgi:hypothetical protein